VDYPSGEVTWNERPDPPTGEFELRTELNTDVGMIKSLPGIDHDLLDAMVDRDGVVLEGTGLGHFPVNSFDEHTEHHADILDTIAEIAGEGVAVMASQCINGRVNMNIYQYGVKIKEAGVISAGTMTPEIAYVKLMWSLGQADSDEEAAELFRTDVAGEIVDREEYDGFARRGDTP
ncbi:MAG: hypothetical protein ABEK12_04360, partial [Candidatus Nanohaloarchaea archaeon]